MALTELTGTITMTQDFTTKNKLFKRHHSYDYDGYFNMEVDCEDCKVIYKHMVVKCYRIIIEGIGYMIPELFCFIPTDHLSIPEGQEDKQDYWERELTKDAREDDDGKTDYVLAAKEELGVDITYKGTADHNGTYILKKVKERYGE